MRLRPAVVLPFAAMLCVFTWQLVIGLIIGREAGFMLYAIVGLLPLVILGFPWFLLLMPSGDLDLTSLTSLTLRYHAAAFVSLMLNAFLLALLFGAVRRSRERARGRPTR